MCAMEFAVYKPLLQANIKTTKLNYNRRSGL